MYCLIKNEMKFGDYVIPARTKATVINTPNCRESNVPGLDLYLAISLKEIAFKINKDTLLSELEIKDELNNGGETVMTGITIWTNGNKVLMDAGDNFYDEATLYEHQVIKVLGVSEMPQRIEIAQYTRNKYYLEDLVSYLEDQFAEWVQNNCEFYTYTEEDIENGECYADAEAGDTTLSDKGIEQFEKKKVEYQSMLERIGFTYDFNGGLIWE